MTGFTIAKLVLAAMAVGVFVAGVRLDNPAVRWTAVGLLVLAFALRFVARRG
jgi:hypothetical protein